MISLTIYADVLLVLNLYVNYFILKAVSRITHSPLRFIRCLAASAYGSLFSLIILLPELPVTATLIIRLFAAVTICAAAFSARPLKRLLTDTAVFFAVNFIFGGVMYAVSSWSEASFISINNSSVYINFSLLVLIITTSCIYAAVHAAVLLTSRSASIDAAYKVIIRHGCHIVSLCGLADTGSSLVDFFTGAPVIVCSEKSAARFFGSALSPDSLPKGFRLIPCSTIAGKSVIPVFQPDEIIIRNELSGCSKKVDAVVGFASCGDSAVFNPKILKL